MLDWFIRLFVTDDQFVAACQWLLFITMIHGSVVGTAIVYREGWEWLWGIHKWLLGLLVAGAIIASNSLSSLIELFF